MRENVLDLQRLPEIAALDLGPAQVFGFGLPTVPTVDPEPTCTLCSHTCSSTAEE